MKVCVKVITHIAIFLYHYYSISISHELLLESVATSLFVICIGKVTNSDALASMFCPYPVGIRQIDTYCCRWILVAAEHSCTNDIRRYALHFLFAETRVDRTMVFKPLRILADCLGASRGLQILILNYSLPRTFKAERVAINLDEAIYKIYLRLMLADPLYAIVVEKAQVARSVIPHKRLYILPLLVILSHAGCFFQPVCDVLYGIGIHAVLAPHEFHEFSVTLYQFRVKSIR